MAILPQDPAPPESLTVRQLVAQGRYPHQRVLGRWSTRDENAVAAALVATNIVDLADRPLDELSGGQRQHAWIALTLAQETDVLLLDEPTTYLHMAHQVDVLELLADLNRRDGRTIVMVLHDLNQAARYADDMIALRAGRIIAAGPPADVVTEELVQEVFGLDVRILEDPLTGGPLCVPARNNAPRPRRNRPAVTAAPSKPVLGEAAPLVATLARGRTRTHRGCHLGAHVGAAGVEGAVTLHTLTGDPARLGDVLARVGDDVGSPRADVQASLFLEAYAWTLLLPLAGALVVERRVPLFDTDGAAVVLRDDLWPDDLVLARTRFAGLPGDHDAGHPDAVTVANEQALAATLRDQVIEHLRRPIAALASHSRRPQRALWRSVADRLAAAALFAAETVRDVPRGTEVARAVLSGPPPLLGRPDYRIIAAPHGPMRVYARQGCCLWWRTQAATYCLSCPCARSVA